ncbi:uncharacterized protein TNCV_2250481 [Trichonephila clavipes]|nr:uncharacterized protein TNCV_2250481 [Trichonephila clavipes]
MASDEDESTELTTLLSSKPKLDELKLIQLIKARRAIYDPNHPKHRYRTYIDQLWNEISKEMGVSDNLVALHFKYDQARRRFVERAQNEIAIVPDFHKRILFSDEAHFWLNGYVNKQNCRIWSEANPQVYVETPLHPEKLIVWCALWAGGILQKR